MLESLTCRVLALVAAWDNTLDNTAMEALREGRWWDAIRGVFGSPIGEFFFAFLFLLGPAILYIKTQNVVPAAMAMLVGGAVFAFLFTSPVRFFFALMAVFGITVVLWELMKK